MHLHPASGHQRQPAQAGHALQCLLPKRISRALAPSFWDRLQSVAQDFAKQHLADQKVADKDRTGYTLVMAMRDWEFAAFVPLQRKVPAVPKAASR